MPSVPSEPTSSRPGRSRRRPCAPARRPRTARRAASDGLQAGHPRPVTPYLKACGPPAFVAMLPPICDCSAAPGSGGKSRPLSRASRRTSAVRHARLDLGPPQQGSNERTRVSRSSETTTPPSIGTRPPAKPCRRRAARPARHARSTTPRPPRPPRPSPGSRDRVGAAAQAAGLRRILEVVRARVREHGVAEGRAQLPLERRVGGESHGAEVTRAAAIPLWTIPLRSANLRAR